MSFIIKRDTLIILQIFILIIIGFIIKDKFFNNKNKIEHFETTNNLTESEYNDNIIIYYDKLDHIEWNDSLKNLKMNKNYNKLVAGNSGDVDFNYEELRKNEIDINKFRAISISNNQYIILYNNNNFKINENNNAYVINSTNNLIDEFQRKIKSIKIINSKQEYETYIIQQAKQENKIFLFTEQNFMGKIIAINIPSKSQENYKLIDNTDKIVNIKSIIIPHDNNVNLELGDQSFSEKQETMTANTNQYKITALLNNIDTLGPLKVLNNNIDYLTEVNSKFDNIFDNIQDNKDTQTRTYNTLVDNFIDDLHKNIENKQNKINYKVNQFGNYY